MVGDYYIGKLIELDDFSSVSLREWLAGLDDLKGENYHDVFDPCLPQRHALQNEELQTSEYPTFSPYHALVDNRCHLRVGICSVA